MEKQRTIKLASEHFRYDLLSLSVSPDKTSSKEIDNPQNVSWWQVKEQRLGQYRTMEEARQHLKEQDSPSDNVLGYEIRDIPDMESSHVEIYDAHANILASYEEGFHRPGGKKHHEPCRFSQGDKVFALLHAPYDAVIPCEVVGHITEESEREDWNLNNPKDYHSTYEEYVESWGDWHWDCMVVRPLVKLKSMTWGDTMTEMVTVPRIYLFPYREF